MLCYVFVEKITVYSKGYCHAMPLLLLTFCSVLSKTKNNVKDTLFSSIPVRIRQNNQIFVKDCFSYETDYKNILIAMFEIKCPLAAN